MPEKIWKVTNNDLEIARRGLEFQAQGHNLSQEILSDENFNKFLDHEASVKAAFYAETRYLWNLIQERTYGEGKDS